MNEYTIERVRRTPTGKRCPKCKKPIWKVIVPDRAYRVCGGEVMTYNAWLECPCGYSCESLG